MLNDIMQSLLAAIYPMLKTNFQLDFWQIGLLTLAFQVTASLLQPLVGIYTDKRPLPYSLTVGMGSSLIGLIAARLRADLLRCWSLGACFIGIGSSIFHPEILARRAAGLGRALRPRAVAVPGRRQFRPVARAAAGRLHRRAVRAGQRRLVLARRAARHGRPVAGRQLVQQPSRATPSSAPAAAAALAAAAPHGGDRADRAGAS